MSQTPSPPAEPDSPSRPDPNPATPPPASPAEPKPGLSVRMRRWLPRFSRDVPRDSTGGINISGDAKVNVQGDLVAGDKVFNVGSLSIVVPTRFFLILLGLVLLGAVGYWLRTVPATMPTDSSAFNIAVADFGVQDAQGNVTSSAEATKWSQWVFDTLLTESGKLPTEKTVTVWHDSLRPFQERANIGLIQGSTPAEREKAAEAKATELAADLLIYGNMTANQPPGTFVPEFYLAKGRDEADEMRGAQAMGEPFSLPSKLDPADQITRSYLTSNLTPRAVALAWFVPGLIDDLSGNFESAHANFLNGLAQSEGLQTDQGKAIFYYYIGREALFLSQDEARASKFFTERDPGMSGAHAALNAAEEAFQTAIGYDNKYARAHFGLGSAFYQRANLFMSNTFPGDPPRQPVPGLLDAAIAEHQRALELAAVSPDSLIDIQSRLHLGFDYYQKGRYALDEKNYAEAERFFGQARSELETGLAQLPSAQHRTLAQAHLAIATTDFQNALARQGQNDAAGARTYYDDAIAAYDKCIAEANALPEDAYLSQVRKTCEANKAVAEQAR